MAVGEGRLALRAYCHINEFREEGYARLPQMMVLADPLVLWSPSGRLIDNYHGSGVSALSSGDLLRFVEKGHVVIIGREKWLADEEFRNEHSWKFAKWLPEFDGRILELAVEDDSKRLSQRRVAVMPEETGWDWADRRISRNDPIVDEVHERIRRRALPPGFLSKAKEYIDETEKVKSVLRDLRDHAMVPIESSSDLPIVAWNEAQWLLAPASHKGIASRKKLEMNETEERFIDGAVRLMERIDSFPDIKLLDKFLESRERRALQEWLWGAFSQSTKLQRSRPDVFLKVLLARAVDEGMIRKRRRDWVLPHSWYQRGISVTGICLTALGVYLGSADISSWAGVTAGLSSFGDGLLERVGLKNLSYSGPQWPFLCTIGRSPKYKDFCRLLTELKR